MGKSCRHHPDKASFPDWVIVLPNFFFHKVCTIVQRMRAIPENLASIRGLIDALEFEYLRKRRALDEADQQGTDDDEKV